MKKLTSIISVTCAAALAMSMCACSPKQEEPIPQEPPKQEAPEATWALLQNVTAEGYDPQTSTRAWAKVVNTADYDITYTCTTCEYVANSTDARDTHTEEAEEGHDYTYTRTVTKDGEVVENEDALWWSYTPNENDNMHVAEGTYEVTWISPINADGSIYIVPDCKDLKTVDISKKTLPQDVEFTLIPAEEVTPEQMASVVAAQTVANDTILSDEEREEAQGRVKANAEAAPNVDAETTEAAQEAAEVAVASGAGSSVVTTTPSQSKPQATQGGSSSITQTKPSTEQPTQTKPSGTASGNQGGNAPSQGNSGSSAQQPSTPSQPTHTHDWQPVYTTEQVMVTPGYDILHCGCGNDYTSEGAWEAHQKADRCKYGFVPESVDPVYDTKQTLTGYKCSCGATK